MPKHQPSLELGKDGKGAKPRTRHGGECEFCIARREGRKLRRANPCADKHQGRRKQARPHSARTPLHVTFRSQKAKGALSLLHPSHARPIRAKTQAIARRFRVRVLQYANAGNHLHLLVEGRSRDGIKHFLRTMGAQVATLVTKARKGRPFGKFWDDLVFSRIVTKGPDLTNVRWYILKNHLESEGVVQHERTSKPYKPRKHPPPFPRDWEGLPN